MRAVVLERPGSVDELRIVERPIPATPDGWVRVAVKAFGLNRSELHLRLGYAEGARFPIVPGIEAVGVVDEIGGERPTSGERSGGGERPTGGERADGGGGELRVGQQVAVMMGGMGRQFDGGYAEYTVVPRAQVVPFRSALGWDVLGAVPETLQTAYGSLTTGLDLQAGQTLLIRGGTSALGYATAALAKDLGATVLATTRQERRLSELAAHGVDHPILDDGAVAERVREIVPEGVHAALELVGTPTLPDTLRATRVHGTVCFAGMLSDAWVVKDFYPIGYLPVGVRLTAYGGDASDLPPAVLQRVLDRLADGTMTLGPVTVRPMSEIRRAHHDIEVNAVSGKVVMVV